MSDTKLTNVPSMSAGAAVNELVGIYCPIIEKGLPVATMPSVMMWGPPGVGKSQAVREIAEEIETITGKRTVVTDARLLLFNPVDLRGIPTANEDKTLAVWLKPKIFQMDESEDVVNILFLDEISAAPASVQAAAYQITLDRVVGEHALPENCIVIAAGNRTTDKSVAYKMPKALANRLMHFEIEVNFEAWRQWAVGAGVNEKVIGFLSFKENFLMDFDAKSEDLAFATPRSWEMVSNILNNVSDDLEEMFPLISGLVGSGVAIELRTWDKVCGSLPSIDDIFAGKDVTVPGSTDVMYALTSAMTAHAREHVEDLEGLGNSIAFATKMPPDFCTMLMKDYMYLKGDCRSKLMQIPEFMQWMSTYGKLLNGLN